MSRVYHVSRSHRGNHRSAWNFWCLHFLPTRLRDSTSSPDSIHPGKGLRKSERIRRSRPLLSILDQSSGIRRERWIWSKRIFLYRRIGKERKGISENSKRNFNLRREKKGASGTSQRERSTRYSREKITEENECRVKNEEKSIYTRDSSSSEERKRRGACEIHSLAHWRRRERRAAARSTSRLDSSRRKKGETVPLTAAAWTAQKSTCVKKRAGSSGGLPRRPSIVRLWSTRHFCHNHPPAGSFPPPPFHVQQTDWTTNDRLTDQLTNSIRLEWIPLRFFETKRKKRRRIRRSSKGGE